MLELMAPRAIPPIDYRGVPAGLRPKIVKDKTGRVVNVIPRVSAVCRTIKECEDLVYWYGDATFCPFAPVLLLLPGGPALIAGDGAAPAAELRDVAVATWNRRVVALLRHKGSLLDFDVLREKAGMVRKAEVADALADALARRIAHHRAHPITDPPRQPLYIRPNNFKNFQVPEKSWQEASA